MRKLIVFCCALLLSSMAMAQGGDLLGQTGHSGMTYGEFAVLVVQQATAAQDAAATQESALGYLRGYGFVPSTWASEGALTHGDLAHVLARAGITYEAADPTQTATRDEVTRLVQLEEVRLREYFRGTGDENCSHGYFSQLLVRAITPPQDALPDQQTSMDLLKNEGLVPLGWTVPDILTHAELKDVFSRMGVLYETVDQDEPVSVPFAIAIVRRELSNIKDYWAKRMGHGFAKSHILDLGIDRAVSPSAFYHRAHVVHGGGQ